MTVCNVLEIYPECLDGAQMYLHPTHGISIPQAYTSYIAPLSSTKLWNMAKIAFPTDNTGKVSHSILYCVSLYYLNCDVLRCTILCPNHAHALLSSAVRWSMDQGLETPYVVRLHNCHVTHDEKPVFTFDHPNREQEPIDNTRYVCEL